MSGIAIAAGVAGVGAIAGSAISANAAGKAASTQANSANQSAQLQYQASQNALAFQQQQWNTTQGEMQPYLQAGNAGLSNLQYLLGIGSPQGSVMNASPGVQGTPASSQLNESAPISASIDPGRQFSTQPGTLTPYAGAGAAPGSNPYSLSPQSASGLPSSAVATNAGMPAYSAGNTGPVPVPSVPGGTPASTTPTGLPAPNTSLGGFGSLMQAYPGGPFVAPTAEEALQSPGEQAQLRLGEQAMQQSAAARGSLLTGGTAQALDAYGQDLASTNYQNTYNNAYNTYSAGYNQYEQQQTNEYNRLAALAGVGQQTASTLGTLGQNNANATTSNLLNTSAQIGAQYNNAGSANASGILGTASAINGGISGATNGMTNLMMLSQLQGSGANPAAGAASAASNPFGGMS